jgi:hypothetical protein
MDAVATAASGRVPKFRPDAEAVTSTAPVATTTAAMAKPAIRK